MAFRLVTIHSLNVPPTAVSTKAEGEHVLIEHAADSVLVELAAGDERSAGDRKSAAPMGSALAVFEQEETFAGEAQVGLRVDVRGHAKA